MVKPFVLKEIFRALPTKGTAEISVKSHTNRNLKVPSVMQQSKANIICHCPYKINNMGEREQQGATT